ANSDGNTDAADWVMWRWQSTPAARLGDLNGDGSVDELDYVAWASSFGMSALGAADANGNGVVDAADYVMWRSMMLDPFGAMTSEASAVPEPSVLLLFAEAVCISLARFNRLAQQVPPCG